MFCCHSVVTKGSAFIIHIPHPLPCHICQSPTLYKDEIVFLQCTTKWSNCQFPIKQYLREGPPNYVTIVSDSYTWHTGLDSLWFSCRRNDWKYVLMKDNFRVDVNVVVFTLLRSCRCYRGLSRPGIKSLVANVDIRKILSYHWSVLGVGLQEARSHTHIYTTKQQNRGPCFKKVC